MTYDEIIEQLEITKNKIKEIARNEYGGESWNDDLDALTEAADIVADYSKARRQAPVPAGEEPVYIQRAGAGAQTFRRSHQAPDPGPWNRDSASSVPPENGQRKKWKLCAAW